MDLRIQADMSPAIAASAARATSSPQRLSGAAKEFESILLNQWLQGAESTFGSAPGADDSEDEEGTQMKGFATQQLAGRLAANGGLGIGRLVERGLQQTGNPGLSQRSLPPAGGENPMRALQDVRQSSIDSAGPSGRVAP